MMQLFPPTANANAKRLVAARGLRALADGYVSILLPAYLLALGLDAFEVGVLATATLLGSASLTLCVGFITSCFGHRRPLLAADVPTRNSYVMAVVTPRERAAAASVTSVPRSLASAVGPVISGYLFLLSGFGWPLLIGGILKASYDLALLAMFSHVRPPEERGPARP
jgi:MFS family permease